MQFLLDVMNMEEGRTGGDGGPGGRGGRGRGGGNRQDNRPYTMADYSPTNELPQHFGVILAKHLKGELRVTVR